MSAAGDPPPPADDGGDPFAQLLAEALEQIERGEPVDPAVLCKDHPELQQQLVAALGQVARLPDLHRKAADIDQSLGGALADRYDLEQRIGAGAMGVVYAARDRRLDREVAIKVLRPDLVVGARMDTRLAREGEVLARIRHRNVVTVHDCGRAGDGRTFLVLERLQGCTVAQLLRNETVPGAPSGAAGRLARFVAVLGEQAIAHDTDVRQVVDWIVQACAGVQAAHETGVVHRDLKPSNLFLERSGRLVVLDFGIVSVGEHPTVGSDGYPLGTPAYMAPEQVRKERAPDVQWDVYGLAATLYHLLTGHAPYRGTLPQVLDALRHGEPTPADRLRPGLPIDLLAVLEKGMARSPSARYATVQELRNDLVAWLEFRPVSARRRTWLAMAATRVGRSPFARATALLLVLLAIAGFLWHRSEVHAERRTARELAIVSSLPPSLLADLPASRAGNPLRRSAALDRTLAEWIELTETPWMPRAVRAVHRLDGGDFAGAATDVAAIVALGDAPFAAGVQQTLAAGQPPQVPAVHPPVGGLHDRCLLVQLVLRQFEELPAWVGPLLEVDDAHRRHDGIAHLWAIVRMAEALQRDEFRNQERRFLTLEEFLVEHATRREAASAILSHVASVTQVFLGRFAAGRAAAEQGLTLAPDDYSLAIQVGTTRLRTGDAEAALSALRRAIELHPNALTAHESACDALLALGRIDEAERLLDAPVFAAPGRATAVRLQQLGLIALARYDVDSLAEALAATFDRGRAAAVRAHLARARDHFAAADATGEVDVALERVLCAGLLGEPFSTRDLFELLAQRPIDAALLERAVGILPKSLDAAEVEALVAFLTSQVQALGGRPQ